LTSLENCDIKLFTEKYYFIYNFISIIDDVTDLKIMWWNPTENGLINLHQIKNLWKGGKSISKAGERKVQFSVKRGGCWSRSYFFFLFFSKIYEFKNYISNIYPILKKIKNIPYRHSGDQSFFSSGQGFFCKKELLATIARQAVDPGACWPWRWCIYCARWLLYTEGVDYLADSWV
jgi:hypothetical protein